MGGRRAGRARGGLDSRTQGCARPHSSRPLRSPSLPRHGGPWSLPSLVAVEILLASEPHYVGGLVAFTLHRLTQQQYLSVVDAFITGFRRSRRLGDAEVRFHRRKPSVFASGLT